MVDLPGVARAQAWVTATLGTGCACWAKAAPPTATGAASPLKRKRRNCIAKDSLNERLAASTARPGGSQAAEAKRERRRSGRGRWSPGPDAHDGGRRGGDRLMAPNHPNRLPQSDDITLRRGREAPGDGRGLA